jgi:hypothetical protein
VPVLTKEYDAKCNASGAGVRGAPCLAGFLFEEPNARPASIFVDELDTDGSSTSLFLLDKIGFVLPNFEGSRASADESETRFLNQASSHRRIAT